MAASSRRDLIYRMTADPQGFKKGMEAAGESSKGFWRELRKLEQQQKAVDEVMTMTGTALLGFGVAAGAGLALATKAAIDWESAWTGVAKVVDGSPEQLAALEEELRGLATTLPQTHAEIAGVAAAAGQLGVATEDIGQFTEVMVALGVSTNLASEEAAFALSRLMNIMQTSADDVDNLGSTIVGLGNNSATTEAEITAMALRIAGAGQTIGLTEANVLGFSAALSSVGIEAEAGGTAISMAFKTIDSAVRSGGEELEAFAQVAGMTADDFATKFRQAPAEAINDFVVGLGRMNDSGGDVNATLSDLGLSGIRISDSLLRMAGAGDLLAESLRIGNEEWDENSALMEEASRRYGTTEAQIQIARNQIVDFAIDLGENLLPMVNQFLDVASGMASFFSDLPDPVKTGIVVLGGIAAAVGLLGGAALLAIPKIHAFNLALGEMGTKRAATAQKALRGLTGFLGGPWGIAIGAAVTVLGLFAAGQAESRARTDELSSTLDDQTSAVTGNTKAWIANQLETEGALELAQDMGIDLATLVDAIAGEQDALDEVNGVLDEYRKKTDEGSSASVGLTDDVAMLTGEGAKLNTIFQQLTGDLDDATAAHERTADATGETASAAEDATGAGSAMAEQLGITTGAAEEAADAFDDLESRVRELIDSAFALNGAQRDVEAGIDAVTEALEENGATVDRNTEAGRANEVAIEDQVEAIADLAVTTAEQTGSTEKANEVLAEQRERLEEVLRAAGFTSEEIREYTSVLDAVPGEIDTIIETSGLGSAIDAVGVLNARLNAIDRTVRISFETEGFVPRGGASIPNEEGGVYYHAQEGLLRDAGVFSSVFPARFAFAEPATGGEAFIPKIGDRSRSLNILQEAAAWHRASVVPNEAGPQVINVNVTPYGDRLSMRDVMDDLEMRGLV